MPEGRLFRDAKDMAEKEFHGLSDFSGMELTTFRNSYGYLRSHIYETVKLNQIKS